MTTRRTFEVAFAYPAIHRKERGRTERVGFLRDAFEIDVAEIPAAEAPVAIEAPELPNEPYYRAFGGDLWHPMTNPDGPMGTEGFARFLREGDPSIPLLLRHPASIGSCRQGVKPFQAVGTDKAGRRTDLAGLATPFDRGVEDPAGRRVVESDRDVVLRVLSSAAANFALVDGVVHRRCAGPAVKFEKDGPRLVDSVEAFSGRAGMTAFRGRRVVECMPGIQLPPALAAMLADDLSPLVGDGRAAALAERFADVPFHLGLAAGLVASLYVEGDHASGTDLFQLRFGRRKDMDAAAWIHFAARDWNAGKSDLEGFLRRVAEVPAGSPDAIPDEDHGAVALAHCPRLVARAAGLVADAMGDAREESIFRRPLGLEGGSTLGFWQSDSSRLFRDGSGFEPLSTAAPLPAPSPFPVPR